MPAVLSLNRFTKKAPASRGFKNLAPAAMSQGELNQTTEQAASISVRHADQRQALLRDLPPHAHRRLISAR